MNKNETLIAIFTIGFIGSLPVAIFFPTAVVTTFLTSVATVVVLYVFFGE